MEKVTGIGGVFFKSRDPAATQAWYAKHLGIEAGEYGHTFEWKNDDPKHGMTVWSVFDQATEYLDPGNEPFMVNYRVRDLDKMLAQLREADVTIVDGPVDDFGRFAWVLDLDGRKIELWEPPAAEDADAG